MSSRMHRGRVLFSIFALMSALALAGLGGVAFDRTLEGFQPLGADIARQGGGFRITNAERNNGLMQGDIVLAVEGQLVDSVSGLERQMRAEATLPMLVQRGDALVTVTYVRPPKQVDVVYPVLAVVGLLYLLIGLYTCARGRQQSVLFFMWTLASAAFYILRPAIVPADSTDQLIFLTDQAARSLLPALTLHLFLVFPDLLLSKRLSRWLIPCLYLPSLATLGFHADQIFFGPVLFAPATAAQLLLVDRFELMLLVAVALASAWALAVRLAREPRPALHHEDSQWQQRRQTQWILAGLLGGYVPFLLFYLAPYVAGLPTPVWSTLIAVVPLVLVPLAFAYAIFKYKLDDLGIILRDAVSYGAAGVIALFGFQGARTAIEHAVSQDLVVVRTMLTFAAGLLVAGVLAPARHAVAHGLERWQYRGLWGRRRLLQSLGQELLHERDLDRLCQRLVEQLSDALVCRVNLYLLGPNERLAPIRPADDVPLSLPTNALGGELWQRDVQAISVADLPSQTNLAEGQLFAAGYRYAFPITVQGVAVGLLVMSYKYDEDPLDGEDLELIRGLLNQAALAIENARLFAEVRHQLSEVRRLETYNEGILQSSPAGIAVLESGDRIQSANAVFEALCGAGEDAEAAPVIGCLLEDLLPIGPLPDVDSGLLDVAFCEPSGTERYLQLSVAAYQGPGNDDLRVLLVQDISDRIAKDFELREKEHLASLGMLAAGVAHEVNTPLTGISSYAQFLIADTAPDDPHYKLLKKVERQTFRASQIVNNLLDFARNRRGEMTRVALDMVAGEATHLLEVRATAQATMVEWLGPPAPIHVLGNEGELHQVVTNLVANAIDAMADVEGERRVTVRVSERDGQAYVKVSDSGPGIPAERITTIFKPFFSSKLGRGGSGLGLAITYNIVRRHGGEIRVENHSTRSGCSFLVELPIYRPPSD